MQYHVLFLSLLLASSVAAKGNDDKSMKAMSEKAMCKMMNKEKQLIALAGNSTRLNIVTKGNTTKAEAIKAKAATAQTQLSEMETNTTLVASCAVINAAAMEKKQCIETFELQEFVTFAANASAVATVTQNNATKAAKIQAKASQASIKLAGLNANTTLQAACPAVKQQQECKLMTKLEKFVALTKNQTMLDKATKGNTTKQETLKKEAQLAQTQLDTMMSNSTMMAACDALKKQSGSGSAQSSSKPAKSETNNTISSQDSAAVLERLPSVWMAALSTMVALAVGMAML